MYLTKVLFIGIDSADKDLILQWAGAGHLPNFQRLLRKARWGTTRNPPGLYAGAVWPSFYTGVSPAEHGRFCFRQMRPGSYELRPIGSADVKVEPFWNFLSRAHKRVGIIDVPKTLPSINLNGIQVADWGSDEPYQDKPSTWPQTLAEELVARFGKGVGNSNASNRDTADFAELRDSLLSQVKKKAELTDYLLQQGEWDCFITVFTESHAVGHQCWHFHDPDHPRFDAEATRVVGNPIKDVYVAIDAAIGELMKKTGPDTLIFVLATHGMGPRYDGTSLLDEILQRLETQQSSFRWSNWSRPADKTRGRLYARFRKSFAGFGARAPHSEAERRAKRKCFQVPNNDVYGGIRINLIGREPSGKVQPGQDYDAFCETLADDMLSFINLDTGEPLVRQVLRTDKLYRGKYLDHLPDLMVEWNRSAPIVSVFSPKTGKIEGTVRKSNAHDSRSGDHKPDGLFFVVGPWVDPGMVGQVVDVMDFAPTIASYLGVELPRAEGRSILPAIL